MNNHTKQYGLIGEWDTSEVQELFYNRGEFNENIFMWNVSKVTNISRMFEVLHSINHWALGMCQWSQIWLPSIVICYLSRIIDIFDKRIIKMVSI